jgi:hypothetical protein
MKHSSGPTNLSDSVRQRLNRFAIATILFVGTLALPAEAKIVYTHVNITITGNGSIRFDLNHDGITDFVIHSVSGVTSCGDRDGLIGSTKITPATGNGVVVSHLYFAELLASGTPIGAGADFYKGQAVVTQFFICSEGTHTASGYLGLEFQINGQTHYGWAGVNIYAYYSLFRHGMRTTLIDFAYETVAGMSIKAAQTKEADDPTNDFSPDASLTNPVPNRPQHASLGMLALGSQAVPLWRRKESVDGTSQKN